MGRSIAISPEAPVSVVSDTQYDAIAVYVQGWEASHEQMLNAFAAMIAANADIGFNRANNLHVVKLTFAEMYQGLCVDRAVDADVHSALYDFLPRFSEADIKKILYTATVALRSRGTVGEHESLRLSSAFRSGHLSK